MMSVGLGTLPGDSVEFLNVDVSSSDYDQEWIRLEQPSPDSKYPDVIILNRQQMQMLSQIIDRFMDK